MQAGLFSAVTSAFIIQVDSQLKPDPNDETAALIRVLIFKIDNSTFGNNIPTLPQWTGPPRTMVQVQAILFASLTISLFSAFLAMLGKQWLNRYQSTDMRGSAIERSHNRQQKLGGIVTWYFDHVMESLPLMLQAALLLLGCALSHYLWEINIAVALIVLVVTSFGVIFYLFIVAAGIVFESCPYQTPAAHIFRYILHHLRHHLLSIFHSAFAATFAAASSNFSRVLQASQFCRRLIYWWSRFRRPWYSMSNVTNTLPIPIFLFTSLLYDICRLVPAILRLLIALCRAVYRRLAGGPRTTHRWFKDISSLRTFHPDQRAITLDLRCISWILQASLDRAVHLTTFNHLISMPELGLIHPTLVVDCFNIFIRCINVYGGKVVIIQGLERLATASANALFRTLHHLATMDPASGVLADLQRRYNEVFDLEIDSTSLPFHSTMAKIHALAGRFGNPRDIRWYNHRMSIQEHVPFAQRMNEAARDEYQKTREKVPRWVLRTALYFLSLGSLSPASVIADCLTIIATDLGCAIPSIANLDERCVRI